MRLRIAPRSIARFVRAERSIARFVRAERSIARFVRAECSIARFARAESRGGRVSAPAVLAALGIGAVLGPLASCASTGPGAGGTAVRVILRDYKSGHHFELVSESRTDQVELYSAARSSASCKVQTDEVMEALIEHLDELGFFDHDVAGSAPRGGGGAMVSALEVDGPDGTSYVIAGAGTPVAARRAHAECVRDFLVLFNATQGFQAVENATGAEYFEQSAATIKKTN